VVRVDGSFAEMKGDEESPSYGIDETRNGGGEDVACEAPSFSASCRGGARLCVESRSRGMADVR